MKIKDLTKQQLKGLRQEVVLNSLFLDDYDNSYDIDKNEVYDFFDGYTEYISEYLDFGQEHDKQFIDVVRDYDNEDNLYNYWCDYVAGLED